LVKQSVPVAEGNWTHNSSTFPVAVVQSLNVLEKLVAPAVKSNRPVGIDAKEVQPLKVDAKLVVAVWLSNKPDGILVKEVQPLKVSSILQLAIAVSNKPDGIDVISESWNA